MTWVKICGLTSAAGVEAAVVAGVDAIGFVFAPSKRQVSAERAAQLAHDVPIGILRVAVMLHPEQRLVDEVCAVFRPDVLQTDLADLDSLDLPAGLTVIPVVRGGGPMPATMPQRVLFEGAVSGCGATADWNAAARLAKATQLVLAGGLDAQNVAAAIAAVQPFGVDVSSGVEAAPGVKDPHKIHEFVRRARAANGAR